MAQYPFFPNSPQTLQLLLGCTLYDLPYSFNNLDQYALCNSQYAFAFLMLSKHPPKWYDVCYGTLLHFLGYYWCLGFLLFYLPAPRIVSFFQIIQRLQKFFMFSHRILMPSYLFTFTSRGREGLSWSTIYYKSYIVSTDRSSLSWFCAW